MRKNALCLLLSLCLLLTGCAALLDRPYVVVASHQEHPVAEEDDSVVKASSKQELVNVIHYFVAQGIERGVVKLVDYGTPVETDLYDACLEVATVDPLGAYAVEFIKHDYTRVLTGYEANIHITYRRTPEQIRGVVNVTGSSGIRKEVGEALSDFRGEAVLQVAYFVEDADYIGGLVRQAYYDTPAAALGMPEYTVAIYPDRGSRRIVEITLEYPDEPEVLRAKSAALLGAAETLVTPLRYQFLDTEGRLALLFEQLPGALRATGGEVPSNTAWDALLGSGGDSEGLALAFQLLCGLMGVDCATVQGTLDGAPHFWNVVAPGSTEEWYVDLTRSMEHHILLPQELVELGYGWDGAPQTVPVSELPQEGAEKNENSP